MTNYTNANEVLTALQSGAIDLATAQKLIAEFAKPVAKPVGSLTYKVSAKGAVSVYGMGRWPVTLYKTQWQRLSKEIKEGTLDKFIAANEKALAVKEGDEAPAPAVEAPKANDGEFGGKPVAA